MARKILPNNQNGKRLKSFIALGIIIVLRSLSLSLIVSFRLMHKCMADRQKDMEGHQRRKTPSEGNEIEKGVICGIVLLQMVVVKANTIPK